MSVSVWIVQLRKGLLEFCVLNLLSQGESYGYEIAQALKNLRTLDITESTLYPILTRLRKEGHLRVRAAPSSAGPPRRYYALTASGRQRVEEMNAYWQSLNVSIQQLIRGEMEVGSHETER